MKRRTFVISGMTSLAGLSFLSFPFTGCKPVAENYPLLQDFLPKETIRLIGREYVKIHPGYQAEGLLSLPTSQLAGLVRKDFLKDNIMVVGGWVLSRTEARHCASLYRQNR